MNKKQIDAVLESVRSWPREDQQELVELAREIEARRTGTYALSDEERRALAAARRSPLADHGSRPSGSGMGLHETSLSGASAQRSR